MTACAGSQMSWYTNDDLQAAESNYIAMVVTRYVNSPDVFAWESANEPHCNGVRSFRRI